MNFAAQACGEQPKAPEIQVLGAKRKRAELGDVGRDEVDEVPMSIAGERSWNPGEGEGTQETGDTLSPQLSPLKVPSQ